MSNTSFPASAIVYILDDIPGQGEFQGTGVIIGPHTILTAAHLVYDADAGATADAISLYPGFTPDTTAYNPAGALGGVQSIHTIKVADSNGELSAAATQSDFAVIDTSVDLSRYGKFALDPGFTSGDIVVNGYPASNGGHLSGTGGFVYQDGGLSDLVSGGLALSPGYSGGPLFDTVDRDGSDVDAVVGTVSTNEDAMKLTKAKVALIRHWIASDRSLYAGGRYAPTGLVPQIAGTASDGVDAAAVTPPSGTSALAARVPSGFVYSDAAGHPAGARHHHDVAPVPGRFADLVGALHRPAGGDAAILASGATETGPGLAAPVHAGHPHRITGDA